MRRPLLAALSLTLVLALAGCGGSRSPGGPSGGSSGGTAQGTVASAEDLAAALKRDHADADWYADITGVTQETYLGAPVLVVHTTWKLAGETDQAVFDAVNAKHDALSSAVSSLEYADVANVAALQADGFLSPLLGTGGTQMVDAFDLPPAATTVEGLRDWLQTVYGPGGLVKLGPDERWYEAIESISISNEHGQTGVVVKTSLPTWPGDVRSSLIDMAIRSSCAPVATSCRIEAKDGSGASSSITPGEPGTAAPFLYPAP